MKYIHINITFFKVFRYLKKYSMPDYTVKVKYDCVFVRSAVIGASAVIDPLRVVRSDASGKLEQCVLAKK